MLLPQQYDRTYMGVVVKTNNTGALGVNVQGNVLPARWADPIIVAVGDSVLVQIAVSRTGQSEAIVRGRITSRPRPARGTVSVVPVGSDTITVNGTDGHSYAATFVASYVPTVGDEVILSWNASLPSVVGKVAATPGPTPAPPPPAPAPPPPPAPTTGQSTYPATDSNTYWPPGGWGSWAGGGGHVYQGNYGSGHVYGAWFYSGAVRQLAGRNITRIRFYLGNRRAVGNYNSPVTVHIYVHNSANRPGGDVNRITGPHNVTAWAGQGLTMYDLPLAFGSTLQGGGGIAIYGDPYCGFNGRSIQPDSGKLIIDWST